MSNEEILTGLRNAIEHGENLQTAIQIMINSGYNQKEVLEASNFISRGALNLQQSKTGEQLTMPEKKTIFPNKKKNFFSKLAFWKKKSIKEQKSPKLIQQEKPAELKAGTFNNELKKIQPKKQSHLKEIILLILLLILIGILIIIILFKDKILAWFV